MAKNDKHTLKNKPSTGTNANLPIEDAIEFFNKIRNSEQVVIKFTKKDGTDRVMMCTLNFDKIPKNKHPKKVDIAKILKLITKNKIVHVFDLEKNDWRSVPFDKAKWIEDLNKNRFYIKH